MSSSELPPYGEVGPLRPPDTEGSTAANDSLEVSPELAMVDPAVGPEEQAPGDLQKEVPMSSHAPSDGTFFVPQQEPAPAPLVPAPPVAPTPDPAQPAPVNAMRDVPLGTLIFRAGLLAEEQLEDALQEGMQTGKRLGEVLAERGLIRDSDLGRLLAGQQGLTFVELQTVAVDPAASQRLPENIAKMQNALAFAVEGGVPVVAVADPTNELVVENVRRALGAEPKLVVAAQSDIARKIEEVYTTAAPAQQPAPMAPAEQAAPVAPAAQPAPVAPAAPVAPVEPIPPALQQPTLASEQPAPVEAPPVAPAPTPMPTVVPPLEERIPEALQPLVAAAPPVQAEVSPLHTQAPAEPALTPEAAPVQTPAHPEPVQVAPPAPEVQVAAQAPALPVAPAEAPVAPAPAAEQGLFVQAAEDALTPPAPQPVTAPSLEAPPVNGDASQAAATHTVVLRLTDSDQVEIGGFAGEEAAASFARTVVGRIMRAEEQGEWPFFAERFLRPQTIVSVDVVEHQATSWTGSAERTRWATSTDA